MYHGLACTYDAENNVTAYGAATFGYSADGLRVWKDANGTRTYYLYDDDTLLCELQAVNGALRVSAVYTWGPTGLLARTAVAYNGASPVGAPTWYLFDPNGDVAARLDGAGNAHPGALYDAWGNVIQGTPSADPVGYRGQAGYYTDVETGLILCTHRYYDPAAGRWLTVDPAGADGGDNLYAYCGGDPVNSNDINGTDWLDNASNFSAGVGDSLSFGITDLIRDGMGVNDVVNHSGGAYIAGEVTETAAEIGLTLGSGALKKAATKGAQAAARRVAKRYLPEVIIGLERHHLLAIAGHPGGFKSLFPSAGLIARLAKHEAHPLAQWGLRVLHQTKFLTAAEHTVAHRIMRKQEIQYASFVMNRALTSIRITLNWWRSKAR